MADQNSGGARNQFPFIDRQRSSSSDESRIDELLLILSHHRRRDVLYYLSEHELASIESLATKITAHELDCSSSDVTPDDRKPVLIDLYHNHLPKLTNSGLIEYDRRSGAIKWSLESSHIHSLLEQCYETEHADLDVSE
ncbi:MULTISPECIES: DUF7344 domain-containing protein [Natrialba]|uniref:DUF7344 domain-containing protein n=1 Tax=Natrialba TaxID=63742 RepID=UPI0012697D48|nr:MULTISPECIES: hypothetical protein [Natrialba]